MGFLKNSLNKFLPQAIVHALYVIAWLLAGWIVNRSIWNYYLRTCFGSLIPKKEVLLYLGGHIGDSLQYILKNYKQCYVFEANPEIFQKLSARYKSFPHIKCYNVAVSTQAGTADFYVTDNLVSSSLGKIPEQGPDNYTLDHKIQVPCIYLPDFLRQEKISYIDDYISDIQGMDYAVLSTLRDWIEEKKIGTIQVEATVNHYENLYDALPSNHYREFASLLDKNYRLIAQGSGILSKGHKLKIKKEYGEMDFKWEAKRTRKVTV